MNPEPLSVIFFVLITANTITQGGKGRILEIALRMEMEKCRTIQ